MNTPRHVVRHELRMTTSGFFVCSRLITWLNLGFLTPSPCCGRPRHVTEAPSDGPAAPNELEHDDNGCYHHQQMDQPISSSNGELHVR
jgi:hypothetical protein